MGTAVTSIQFDPAHFCSLNSIPAASGIQTSGGAPWTAGVSKTVIAPSMSDAQLATALAAYVYDPLFGKDQTLLGTQDIATIGRGLRVKEGANAKQGVATLVAGTVTVANTSVTASSRIFLSRMAAGGTLGHLSCTVIVATSFKIQSSSATDTSTVCWEIFEPG